jgi:hypothetical protein
MLGSLNLRNLGLTSLDLSKFGTQLAQNTNVAAGGMVPNLFDPMSQMINPAQALAMQQYNVGTVNDVNRMNTQIENAERSGNTELLNSILEAQTGLRLQGANQQAQAIQGATNVFGSYLGGMGGGGGMGGMMGGGGGGGFNQSQQQLGAGAQSSYGIPNII